MVLLKRPLGRKLQSSARRGVKRAPLGNSAHKSATSHFLQLYQLGNCAGPGQIFSHHRAESEEVKAQRPFPCCRLGVSLARSTRTMMGPFEFLDWRMWTADCRCDRSMVALAQHELQCRRRPPPREHTGALVLRLGSLHSSGSSSRSLCPTWPRGSVKDTSTSC